MVVLYNSQIQEVQHTSPGFPHKGPIWASASKSGSTEGPANPEDWEVLGVTSGKVTIRKYILILLGCL